MKGDSLIFHQKGLLRTPLLPFQAFYEKPEKILMKREFMEAIFLASPDLYKEIYEKENSGNVKLIHSIYKYISRATNRCTPFGLFAGVNLLDWSDQTVICLKEASNIRRITSLDMLFLCALGQHLENDKKLRKYLIYYPNSSYYILENEIRYAEYYLNKNNRTYIISSVDKSHYLLAILNLAKEGCSITDIAKYLKNEGFKDEESYSFIEQLITGKDFLGDMVDIIDRLSVTSEYLEQLKESILASQNLLKRLDDNGINDIKQYENIYQLLKSLELPLNKGKLFQVNAFKETRIGQNLISNSLQKKLLKCISFLIQLKEKRNDELDSFAQKFYTKYEDQEIPLLVALDPDIGIGFPVENTRRDISPLINGIYNNNFIPDDIELNTLERKLARIVAESLSKGQQEIDLSEYRKHLIEKENEKDLPPSFCCQFTLVDDERLQLQSCGGISAGTFVSRFATHEDEIHQVLLEISTHDKKVLPDFDLCEILHLPESRTGNILKHPPFFDHEIPYLAKSTSEDSHKVLLRDIKIFVSPITNKIYLRNVKTNRFILPRLSNAHNYALSNQPVYRFLCELQYQDHISFFNLPIRKLQIINTYLPRLVYKEIILQPATWNFNKSQLEELSLEFDKKGKINWLPKWKIPKLFIVTQGDNYVLFDQSCSNSMDNFWLYVKNKSQLTIKEFIFDANKCPIKDEAGQSYYNEVMAFILNQKTPNLTVPKRSDVRQTRRYFCLGNKWIYYKIYMGTKTADTFLISSIQPIIDKLLKDNRIQKSFFIRFSDPEPHIRLRFLAIENSDIPVIIQKVKDEFEDLINDHIITKFETAIYKREIERYGGEGFIELSETLFFIDSLYALKLIQLVQYNKDENLRWKLAVAVIDQLVSEFGLSIEEKKKLFESLKVSFEKEFKVDKHLRKIIEKKYKEHSIEIHDIINRVKSGNLYEIAYKILAKKREELIPNIKKIDQSGLPRKKIINLLESYIHMSLNRIFISEPRLHELMMYYFLYRHYNGVFFRKKNKIKQRV